MSSPLYSKTIQTIFQFISISPTVFFLSLCYAETENTSMPVFLSSWNLYYIFISTLHDSVIQIFPKFEICFPSSSDLELHRRDQYITIFSYNNNNSLIQIFLSTIFLSSIPLHPALYAETLKRTDLRFPIFVSQALYISIYIFYYNSVVQICLSSQFFFSLIVPSSSLSLRKQRFQRSYQCEAFIIHINIKL